MSYRTNYRDIYSLVLLPAILLSLQLPIAALADDSPALQPEVPSVDYAQASVPNTQTSGSNTETAAGATLHGGVIKHGKLDGSADTNTDTQSPLNGQTSDGQPNLQGETPSADNATLYAQAQKKLTERKPLTAEEFRSLGAGTSGFDADQQYYSRLAKVTRVFAGGPAEQAGIKAGDILLQDEVATPVSGDPTRPETDFSCQRAGDVKDVRVKRHGQILTFHLVAMNIEDIKEPNLRRLYERMIQKYGFPVQNVRMASPITPASVLKGLLGF